MEMTRKKGIGQEEKIQDHLKAIIILHKKLRWCDEFYYKAYVGEEIKRLIKTLKNDRDKTKHKAVKCK